MRCARRPRRARSAFRPTLALLAVLIVLGRPAAAPAQTYTFTGSGAFSNVQNWNFGAGPVPSSGPATTISLPSYGLPACPGLRTAYLNMQPAPVPEPSLVLAVCAGAAAVLRLRRRRPAPGGV